MNKSKARKYIQKRVDVDSNGCWVWKLSKKYGYGQATFEGGLHWRAHRLSYTAFKGDIPEGQLVRHVCPNGPNRACVNPSHLTVGTDADNVHDRLDLKLSDSSVSTIKERLHGGEKGSILATEFDVSEMVISNIKNRKTWKHIK